MALFKFRLPGQGEASDGRRRAGASTNARKTATPSESVESLRQRARHRVIGATVLVAAAVIGFPMLFDTEPRPVGPDVAFHIPDRDDAPPLGEPVRPQESLAEHEEVVAGDEPQAPAAPRGVTSIGDADRAARERAAAQAAEQAARDKEKAEQAARERAAQERAEREKAEKAARERAERERRLAQEKAAREKAAREKAARDKAAREKAERQAKEKAAQSDTGRFVVQVGSFAEDARAKEARSKLERAGISTYIQVINTKDGKRTRVRVGPFGSRAEAEAAAKKVEALGLYAGIAQL